MSLGRIAVYARYSTDRQAASSCDDQIAKLRAYAQARGGDLMPELVFRDEAISGAVRERPGLLALVRAVEAGDVDLVLVEDLGRLSRDVEDLAWIRKRLRYFDVRLVAVDDGLDTVSEGAELMGDVLGGFKALYRREIAAKTLRGMEARARAGFATCAVPYGFSTVPAEGGKRIVIDEAQAAIVRDVFALHAAGRSLAAIAKELNGRDVPPPRSSRARARDAWGTSTIRAILHNEAYIGRWTFGRQKWGRDPDTRQRVARKRDEALVVVDRPELVIIDRTTWQASRARFEACRTVYTGRRTIPAGQRFQHPLSGVLRCAHCESLFTIQASGRYYRCSGSIRGRCDLNRSIKESVVREGVLGAIRIRLRSPGMREAIAEIIADELGAETELDVRRRDLSSRVEQAEARVRRLVVAVADGRAPEAVLAMIRDLEAQLARDRAELEQLAALPRQVLEVPSIDEVLAEVADVLEAAPDLVRGALRRMLDGGEVRVERDGDGTIHARGGLLPGFALGRDVSWIAGALSSRGREAGRFDVLLAA